MELPVMSFIASHWLNLHSQTTASDKYHFLSDFQHFSEGLILDLIFRKIEVSVLPRIFFQKYTQASWSVVSLFFIETVKKFACLLFNFSVLYKYFTFPRLVKIPSVFILPLNNQRKLGNIWRATLHLSGLGWITDNKAMYSSRVTWSLFSFLFHYKTPLSCSEFW